MKFFNAIKKFLPPDYDVRDYLKTVHMKKLENFHVYTVSDGKIIVRLWEIGGNPTLDGGREDFPNVDLIIKGARSTCPAIVDYDCVKAIDPKLIEKIKTCFSDALGNPSLNIEQCSYGRATVIKSRCERGLVVIL